MIAASTTLTIDRATPPDRVSADVSKIREKWGEKSLADGFVVIPSKLVKHQARLGITNDELSVLLHLVMHWWEKKEWPFPSTSTIAERMGGTSQRTVQRYLERLEARSLVRRVPDSPTITGEKKVTRYDLSGLVDALESF